MYVKGVFRNTLVVRGEGSICQTIKEKEHHDTLEKTFIYPKIPIPNKHTTNQIPKKEMIKY